MRSSRAGGTAKSFMTRKITLLYLIIFGGMLLFPLVSLANGLVPCGYDTNIDGTYDPETERCRFCHLFVLFENIIDFVFLKLVPPVAILMLVIGGAMFFLAAGDPGALTKAKSIITTTVIGLVIIYVSFVIVGMFLLSIGLAEWTKDIYSSWWEYGFFTINCGLVS